MNTLDPPAQIVWLPLIEAVGWLFTVTVCCAVAVQPNALVTVTVYVVVVAGFTEMDAVVCAPTLHKYVPPPVAVSVTAVPLQVAAGPLIPATGSGFTVNARVAVDVQPAALVTVTV